MKLSICMATRNGEAYLAGQLASILCQLGPEDEVIISDDTSTDGTLEVIAALADPRIRLLPGNTFFSPIYNLENALRQASGAVIVLADQDDLWLDNKLPLVRKVFANRVGRIHLAAFDASIIDAQGREIAPSLFARNRARTGLLKNLYDNTYTGCTLAFTCELLDIALPFPAGLPMHDSWLGLLAERCGTVEFVHEITMLYRRHGANVSCRRPLREQLRGRFFLAWNLWKRKGCKAGRKKRKSLI